jgi:DNA-binding response OmpR family regulator
MTPAPTILLVEDDTAVAAAFERMLRLSGYAVLLATTAEAALQQFKARRADAAIVDFRLPTIDGLEFVHRLREAEGGRFTSVAIVTGDYALDDATYHALTSLGATVHFKPLWLEDLVVIARSLTDARD